MEVRSNILVDAKRYIDEYGLECSPEELFIHFFELMKVHKEFETYIRSTPHNSRLEKMKRSDRLKEKRKLFAQWYSLQNQDKMSKQIISDIGEFTFSSSRTVYYDLFVATTD